VLPPKGGTVKPREREFVNIDLIQKIRYRTIYPCYPLIAI
ncbi:hypothetical protein AZ019_002285, partial [Klebsiella pneumoniae]